MQVLIIDEHSYQSEKGLQILSLDEARRSSSFKEIESKYADKSTDNFRWALKPFLISWLIEKGSGKVIYVDPDIYFVGPYEFLWKELEQQYVLLTPHWADLDIINNPDSVLSVMKDGLYNAGFIAASSKGKAAIDWWASACLYKMERSSDGLYDDQKYLDLLPVQFEKVRSLTHQGCNLASWNIQSCKREMVNGRLMINGRFEPVFIHFTKSTILNISNRNDALLKTYLEEYTALLKNNGFDLNDPGQFNNVIYKAKHSIRFRTRLKRFFHRLAEKL